MQNNTVQKYGLQIAADYRSVVFGAPSIAFCGEGTLEGDHLTLTGDGVLELTGEGSVVITGYGDLRILAKRYTYFTIVKKVKRNEALNVRYEGNIDHVVRVVITVELEEGASYRERTALHVSGQLDVCTNVFHAPSSTSYLRTRLVLEDGAKAIARGGIVIGREGVGSRGSERLDALLLGGRAEADLLPTLSVANDDVACNHAATVGHADAGVLYYLQSRGLSEQEAKHTLAEAFLSA